jgi:hypothetical protein
MIRKLNLLVILGIVAFSASGCFDITLTSITTSASVL